MPIFFLITWFPPLNPLSLPEATPYLGAKITNLNKPPFFIRLDKSGIFTYTLNMHMSSLNILTIIKGQVVSKILPKSTVFGLLRISLDKLVACFSFPSYLMVNGLTYDSTQVKGITNCNHSTLALDLSVENKYKILTFLDYDDFNIHSAKFRSLYHILLY